MHLDQITSTIEALHISGGLALTFGGLVVGFIVGLTGVGGGSIMTPVLVLVFGIQPHLAIGTDLLFAAITKSGALPNLARQRRIDWLIVGLLSLGSLSASLLTMLMMRRFVPSSSSWQVFTCQLLGVMLVFTAVSMIYKLLRTVPTAKVIPVAHLNHGIHSLELNPPSERTLQLKQVFTCIALGLILGILVTLTSVGAGAIGTAVLIAMFPSMPLARIVGNDIAHAIPLTLFAGLGHAWLGSVDWTMLAWLVSGSLPGIWLGTRSYQRFSERWVRAGLSILLGYAGLRLAII
jgi:uncharacterized protein